VVRGQRLGVGTEGGAHNALRQAREYVADGLEIVVDIDLEKLFDRVNAATPA
jgi:hypothetical protein